MLRSSYRSKERKLSVSFVRFRAHPDYTLRRALNLFMLSGYFEEHYEKINAQSSISVPTPSIEKVPHASHWLLAACCYGAPRY
jgi:hypothetical protein